MIAGRNVEPMPSALTLSSLPLFPLGTVLFPGGVLPLRIFEVRYLDMIGRCHRAGAPFGVVSLTQGSEVRHPVNKESFSTVGTLATIVEFDTPRPGLMVIRCSGAQRFRITASDQLRHGLWVADVQRMDGDMAVEIPDDLRGTAHALGKLIESLQQKTGSPDQMPIQPPWQLDDCDSAG